MTLALAAVTASPAARFTVVQTARPTVSFVYVTFGTDAHVIDESLARLTSSLTAEDIDAEIVVVDNLHPDRAHWIADHLALVTAGVALIRPDENLGFGGGNELGILHTRADVICLINPDLMVHDGWLQPMLAEIRRRPHGIVAPRFIRRDGTLLEAGQIVTADGLTHAAGDGENADYASAACWFFHRAWHEHVGGFDPRFHPAYFEDVDLAFRSARLGGATTLTSVEVIHDHGASTPGRSPDASAQHATLVDLWRDDLRQLRPGRNDRVASIAVNNSSTERTTPIDKSAT